MPRRITPARRRWLIGIAIALIVVALHVDDWGRDFSSTSAATDPAASDARLHPFETARTVPELVEGLRFAARRIGDWTYVGDAGDADSRTVLFVRTNRILRFGEDVTMRIDDLGTRRVVSGESVSRLPIPDLGRNPRNLRTVLDELRTILDGAVPSPVAVRNLERGR